MRLSNDRDKELIRSAVSDAAANLLTFIPSLGTREVFCFGAGVALPTRMRLGEPAPERRPNSEASGSTRSDAGAGMNKDFLTSVIERWRSASMSHRSSDFDDELGSPFDAPSLQPQMPQAAPQQPAYQPPPPQPAYQPAAVAPAPQPSALRSSLLKKPLDASLGGNPPPNMP